MKEEKEKEKESKEDKEESKESHGLKRGKDTEGEERDKKKHK